MFTKPPSLGTYSYGIMLALTVPSCQYVPRSKRTLSAQKVEIKYLFIAVFLASFSFNSLLSLCLRILFISCLFVLRHLELFNDAVLTTRINTRRKFYESFSYSCSLSFFLS